ncbi:MAG: hypothetical protein L3K09_02835 [Thermoplasmata archaeon]|nr:hypothetical protein [Thermoplasmata archaeon]
MHAKNTVLCAWNGVDEQSDRAVSCDRPAVGYIRTHLGGRVYTCEEHIGHAKRDAGSGDFVRGLMADDLNSPATAHAVSRQYRHQESVVGSMA